MRIAKVLQTAPCECYGSVLPCGQTLRTGLLPECSTFVLTPVSSHAQGPPAQQQPPPAQAPSLSSEQARPSPRPLSAGSVPMDLAQAQAQAQAQARRPPMQGMPPPPQQQQQQQARGMPQQYGGMPKPGFAPQHQRPYGEALSWRRSLSAFPCTRLYSLSEHQAVYLWQCNLLP